MKSFLFCGISVCLLIFLLLFVPKEKPITDKNILWKLDFDAVHYQSIAFPSRNFSIQKISYNWKYAPILLISSKNSQDSLNYQANYQIKNFVRELSNFMVQAILTKNPENLLKIDFEMSKANKITLLKNKLKVKEMFFTNRNPEFLVSDYILKIQPYLIARIDRKITDLRQKKIIHLENKKIRFFSFISNDKKIQIQKFDSSKIKPHRKIESAVLNLEVDFFRDEVDFYKENTRNTLQSKIIVKFNHYPEIKISIFEEIDWNNKKLVPLHKEIGSIVKESLVYIEKKNICNLKRN